MRARFLAIVALLFLCLFSLTAQSPEIFNYQGIARGPDSEPYTNQLVGLRFTLLNSMSVVVYTETQSFTTNEFGLINTTIGGGNPAAFEAVDWGADNYSLKVELDMGNDGSWEIEETHALNSVPYALYGEDADADPANELQTISVTGNQLSISDGNTIDLPAGTVSPWVTTGSNIYYNAGLVGIGTDDPSYPLQIISNQLTGRDTMLLIQTADDPGSSLILGNGTISDGKFMPAIMSENKTDHRQSLFLTAQTSDELDDFGGYPLITFDARRTDGAILNRPLFQWSSYTSSKMIILANGNLGIGTTEPKEKLDVNGNTLIRGSIQTGTPNFELNAYGTGNRYAFVDFHGDDDNTDYSLRIIRYNTGVDAISKIHHLGIGPLQFVTANAGPIDFYTNSSHRLRIDPFGKIGIGTASPTSKVQIQGESTWADDDALFEVKNSYGVPVFAVYNNGVRILVDDDPESKATTRGGFAVGGFDKALKGYTETFDFMRITPDSIRFNIDNSAAKATTRGGFAVGGFDRDKKAPINEDFMYLTPQSSTGGLYSTFVGYQSGLNTGSTGEYNTFLGYYSGRANTWGDNNVYIGYRAGLSATTANNNVFIGMEAGLRVTSGEENVMIGKQAGVFTTTGHSNTFVGLSSGYYNTTGNSNTFIGLRSGMGHKTGSKNVFIGEYAGNRNEGGSSNTFVGYYSGRGAAANNGYGNTAMGSSSGNSCQGSNNVYIGKAAGTDNVSGLSNTFVGAEACLNNISSYNTGVGFQAGGGNVGGARNVYLGWKAGYNDTSGSDRLYIDGSGTGLDYATSLIYGYWGAGIKRVRINAEILEYTGALNYISDSKLKTNVQQIDRALEKISSIKGYYFEWNDLARESLVVSKKRQIGVIAQELELEFPELVSENEEGFKTVQYANLAPVLIQAIKEQQEIIDNQDSRIMALENELTEIKSLLSTLVQNQE